MSEPVASGLSLNVGSGAHVAPGWISIDRSLQIFFAGRRGAKLVTTLLGRRVGHWPKGIQYADVRKGLPYADESIAVVYSSHFVEHLHRDEALAFLRDAHRVLKPSGVCRIVVPDLHAAVRTYLTTANGESSAEGEELMAVLNLRDRQSPGRGPLAWYRRMTGVSMHKWMYDVGGLRQLFQEAGFAAPAPRHYLDSSIPRDHLAAVEHPSRLVGGAGICVEALK
jgi:SAM-dependent methyltransferase